MDITTLKCGLWGYKKTSVYEYIATVNENFSNRLIASIQEYDRKIEQLNDKISQLEQENASLRQERDHIAAIFTDAKTFSEDLRTKAEIEYNNFREQNLNYNYEQQLCVKKINGELNGILNTVQNALVAIEQELADKQSMFENISDQLIESEQMIKSGPNHE